MEAEELEPGTIFLMLTSLAADAIVAVHVAYVAFVILAVPAIMLGGLLKAPWARNFWFRHIHLAMIGIVVIEALLGLPCPLTVWENDLRAAAGGAGYEGSFLGRMLHDLLFYEAPIWVFTASYCAFGALVVALYALYPPQWKKQAAG